MTLEEFKAKLRQYVLNVAVAKDRLWNAETGGDPEMTLSGRMGRAIANGRCYLCRPVCAVLSVVFRQPDHCGAQAIKEANEGSDQITPV